LGLGKVGVEAARIEADQLEKNRVSQVYTATLEAEQQEKNRIHQRAKNL
jgi:hypothetical protein